MGPAFLYVAAIVILIVSVVLIVTALRRRIRGLEYKPYLASGCISLICPFLVCAAFGFAWIFSETDFFAAIFFAGLFITAVLPIAAAGAGIVMLAIAWCRRRNGKLCTPFLIAGFALLLYPLALPFATVVGEIIF